MTDIKKCYVIVEFEDGLQIVPSNWLSKDLTRAVWPNFTNNNRYYKAVREMEEPHSTWLEHKIKKVYGTYLNYAIARRKLKQAEEVSDLGSNTETEENQKKSRKFRAAKLFDPPVTKSSSNEDSEESDTSFSSELPTIPTITNNQTKNKTIKKDVNSRNICNSKTEKKDQSQIPDYKKIIFYDDQLNPIPIYDGSNNSQDPQCSKNVSNIELLQGNENNDFMNPILSQNLVSNKNPQYSKNVSNIVLLQDNENNNDLMNPILSSNLAFNENPQYSKNVSNIEPLRGNENNNDLINPILSQNLASNENSQYNRNLSNAKQYHNSLLLRDNSILLTNDISMKQPGSHLNYGAPENFQRFVIQKLVNFESKLNLIHIKQKLILEKFLNNTFEREEKQEREKIDIFQDLPLKNNQDLVAMEAKLKNDLAYRSQMIKQLTRVTCQNIKTSCLRLMRVLLSNELAMNYSWYGAKKKENFSKLDICKIIISVIQKSHADVTDEQISAPIKIWLTHAKERKEREQKKKDNIQENIQENIQD